MKKFTEQEINNYSILKELKPYTNNEEICSTISIKGLTNLKELIDKKLINITFIPKDTLENEHSILLEVALDDNNEEVQERYIYVSSELFKDLISKFLN